MDITRTAPAQIHEELQREPREPASELMELSRIIRCPITHHQLRLISDTELAELKAALRDGTVSTRSGITLDRDRIEAGFATADGSIQYGYQEGIALLLSDLAIGRFDREAGSGLSAEKQQVRSFYEQYGWQTDDGQTYADARHFSDLRDVSAEYARRARLRVREHLPKSGRYILDAASGAIQYPEYLTHSDAFDRRVCVDFALPALRQARSRLGAKGFYVLGDIAHLPLATATMDAAVSLHTVQHIPAAEQLDALRQLVRVVRPGGTVVIVHTWNEKSLLMNLARIPLLPGRALGRMARRFGSNKISRRAPGNPNFYVEARNLKWFRRNFPERFELRVFRSVDAGFLRSYIHARLAGRQLLNFLFWLEGSFPGFFGRFGQHPMFVVRKPEVTAREKAPTLADTAADARLL